MKATDFTSDHRVNNAIIDLNKHFENSELIVSDIIDEHGHQYVDLVQEGGGVLGIALVGYLYILEQFKIRFINLAGTSAGSITTLLLAALGKPHEAKSEKLIELLANKDFYEFVDGTKKAKRFISEITNKKRKWKLAIQGLSIFKNLNNKLGLNPGNNFKLWLDENLEKHNIKNIRSLESQMNSFLPGVKLRKNISGSNKIVGKIKIIASDLTTNTKVIFPDMGDLYYHSLENVNPSDFVRSSMSIPIFFEPFRISDLPSGIEAQKRWRRKAKYEGNIPNYANLVDGGIMSNFPIDVFHVKNSIPRKPTLGIKLGEERKESNAINNIFQLTYSVFDSARQIRDFEFIFNNSEFEKLVTYVDLKDFNWLDFSLSDKSKIEMFVRGAEAACGFLKSFDWNGYKNIRESMLMDDLGDIVAAK